MHDLPMGPLSVSFCCADWRALDLLTLPKQSDPRKEGADFNAAVFRHLTSRPHVASLAAPPLLPRAKLYVRLAVLSEGRTNASRASVCIYCFYSHSTKSCSSSHHFHAISCNACLSNPVPKIRLDGLLTPQISCSLKSATLLISKCK